KHDGGGENVLPTCAWPDHVPGHLPRVDALERECTGRCSARCARSKDGTEIMKNLPMNSHTANATADHDAPVLQIKDLSVRVVGGAGSRYVIQNLNLEVRAGETLCLVGESGSGKSVTSLSVMGLRPNDGLAAMGGRIVLAGEDVLDASPARLRQLRASRMAMVFQEPMTALNPVETVGDQIDEVLRIHGVGNKSERRAMVLEMLNSAHLPDV